MAAYRRVDGLVTCTSGSAPAPTLGNEYGKTFLSFFAKYSALRVIYPL